MQATAFVAHPYEIPTVGWPSDIESWTIDDLRSYYQRYYAPNNAVMFVVGAVTPDEVFRLADKYFASIAAQAPPAPVTTKEPAQLGERRIRIERESQTPWLAMAWHAFAAKDRQTRVMEVLMSILGDGDSSRLHQRLVEKERAAVDLGTAVDQGFDPGLVWVYAIVPPGGDAARTEKLIDEEIARLAQGRTELGGAHEGAQPGARLVLARSRDDRRQGGGTRAVRGVPRRLSPAVRRARSLRKHHRRRRAYARDVRAQGHEPHCRFARIATGGNRIARIRASSTGAEAMRAPRMLALIALLSACAPLALAQSAARGVTLPAFERLTLSNGAQVLLVDKRDTPLVSLAVAVRGGALADASGKEGTAALLAELLQKGAGNRDAATFAETVEGVGAQLTAAASREALVLGASFLSKDTDLMLGLVGDMLVRPRLDTAEFDKARELAVQSIAAAKDSDPSALLGDYGAAWLFGAHIYGRPDGGDPASLESIRLDDVKRYYTEQTGGDRLLIAVVGDIDKAALQRKLETALGSWRKATGVLPTVAAPAVVQGRRVLLIDKPGATQTYFWLGNVGASRTRPGAHSAIGRQHAAGRPIHVDAEHRAAHQEWLELWRRVVVHAVQATGPVQHRVVYADGKDGRGTGPRARDARATAQRRARFRNPGVRESLPARPVPDDAGDQRPDRSTVDGPVAVRPGPGGRRRLRSAHRRRRCCGRCRHDCRSLPAVSQPGARADRRRGADPQHCREIRTADGDEVRRPVVPPGAAGTMTSCTALLVGASGLVGGHCLRLLLASGHYERVLAVVRSRLPTELYHPRLTEIIVDFARLGDFRRRLVADDVFCTLGTTMRKAGSQQRFREVDFEYPLKVAQLLRTAGARHFSIVSAKGANMRSPFFYSRVKGEVEAGLANMGWPSLAIVRPSLIGGVRAESRPLERLAERVLHLAPRSLRTVPAEQIAEAMLACAIEQRPGTRIVESADIPALSRSAALC